MHYGYLEKTPPQKNVRQYSTSFSEPLNKPDFYFLSPEMAKEILCPRSKLTEILHKTHSKLDTAWSSDQSSKFPPSSHYLQDPHACGEIILGSSSDGYYVDEDVPPNLPAGMHVFMLHVPNRSRGGFPLLADSEESKRQWMDLLSKMIGESTGSPDQSVAPSTYEDDDELYASIGEVMQGMQQTL